MAHVSPPLLTYDTGDAPGGEAFETWRQSGWPGFGGAFQISGDVSRFRYRGQLAPTPRLVVSAFDVSGLHYSRPAGLARRDGQDQIIVQATLSGGNLGGEAGGVAFRTGPGSVALVDLTVDIAQTTRPTRAVCMVLARDLFSGPEAEQVVGPGWAPAGGPLLADFMASLLARLPRASAVGAARAERAAAAVLLACRTGDADAVEEVRPELQSVARERARRYVRDRLATPALHAAEIATAVGVSRATLYRLFAPEGGVARFVQNERLAAARTAVFDPADRRSLGDLARDLGFADGAHFSRAFRERYGVRASDLRPVN